MSSRGSRPRHPAVLEALRALSAASDLLDAAVAEHLHLHGTDLRCLDYLARFGLVSAGRLATAVGLSTGALTIAVDRLEKAGYVRRRADPSDRRRVFVELTSEADRVVVLFADLGLATDRLLDTYSKPELQLLGTFLQRASEAFSDEASPILTRRHRRVAPARLQRSRLDPTP